MTRHAPIVCSLVGSCFAAAAANAGSVAFHLVPLNPLDGGNVVIALDINESGVVSGTSGFGTVDPGQHAVVWDGADPENLDPMFDISEGTVINDAGVIAGIGAFCPPIDGACAGVIARALPGGQFMPIGTLGGANGEVLDINASGAFVGWAYESDFAVRAFLFTEEDGLLNLGTLGGIASQAQGISDSGLVAGWSYTAELDFHAFSWKDGRMLDLGTLGGDDSQAFDINNSDTIVGWAHAANGEEHAFRLTKGGVMEDLHTLPGAVSSRAVRINDAGMIGGIWNTSEFGLGEGERLFLFTEETGMMDLGAPDLEDFAGFFYGPIEMNASGSMVGPAVFGFFQLTAWYWSESTGLVLLQDLIADDTDFEIGSVSGINDSGAIAVNGSGSTVFAAVLEPVALLADLDSDGDVDFNDLLELLSSWGACPIGPSCSADLDDSGDVGFGDLLVLLANWTS